MEYLTKPIKGFTKNHLVFLIYNINQIFISIYLQKKLTLSSGKYCITGRMIIVHKDEDDLGKGGDEESLKTDNAGKRLTCGVIGLAPP